jgi:hypothetical protein
VTTSITPRLALGALGACLLLASCGTRPSPAATPTPQPTPTPLAFGVLALGGVASAPLVIGPPYQLSPSFAPLPARVLAARVPASPEAALGELAQELGVPGPPISFGGGLAYNLGATTGYQLTSTPGLLDFNFHPNTPVDETGATPTVAAADSFVERFLAAHHLPGPHAGLIPLPQLTNAHAADRRVFFQWSQDGYPQVSITGQPAEIYADVAANYLDHLSLVGISGAVPLSIQGAAAPYPAITAKLLVADLNRGLLSPNSYLLQANGEPWSQPSPTTPAGPATLTGAELGVVDSAGFAVPVLILQVAGRAPVTRFLMCAAATDACAPLRYSSPLESPSPAAPAS